MTYTELVKSVRATLIENLDLSDEITAEEFAEFKRAKTLHDLLRCARE